MEDATTDEANPDFIRGDITVDLFHPILELCKRPLPWVCPKHGFIDSICHGRFRRRLGSKCLREEGEKPCAWLRGRKERLDFISAVHKRKEDVIGNCGE